MTSNSTDFVNHEHLYMLGSVKISNIFRENGELSLQRIVSLVTVGHHTKAVCHPEAEEVLGTVSSLPCSHSSEVVEVLEFHIMKHPVEALSIAIIPCAETSSFFGPQVDHLTGVVSGIGEHGSDDEGEGVEVELDPVVAEIIVHPQVEELVFVPGI